jgi:hypothetical protein
MSALRSLLRHVVMDIGALPRHRDFRLLVCAVLLPTFWFYEPRSASISSSSASSLR